MEKFIFSDKKNKITDYKKLDKESFAARAVELVWASKKTPDVQLAISYTLTLAEALVGWIQNNEQMQASKIKQYNARYTNTEENSRTPGNYYGRYPTPYIWREVIRKILYEYPKERVTLASVLQYLPVRIVLALGGGDLDPVQQRILQMWNVSVELKDKLLEADEVKFLNHFVSEDAYILLTDDNKLFTSLYNKEVPYSFETIFKAELEEIRDNRHWREREEDIANLEESITQKKLTSRKSRTLFKKPGR